jgi:hypothetical protein
MASVIAVTKMPKLSAAARLSHLRRHAIRAAPIRGTATGNGVNGEGSFNSQPREF